MGKAPVRGSPCLGSQRHICRHRVQACLENPAPGIPVILEGLGIGVGYLPGKGIYFFNIIAVFGDFVNHCKQFFTKLPVLVRNFRIHNPFYNTGNLSLAGLLSRLRKFFDYLFRHFLNGDGIKSFPEIQGKSFLIFRKGHFLFFKYQLSDRIQGIRHISDSEALRACEIINSAAFLNGFPSLHAIINHTGKERQRTAVRMGGIDSIVRIYQQADTVLHLFFVCIIKFFKGAHLFHRAGGKPHLLSFIFSVGENKLQRTAHIEKCGIMPAFGLAGLLRLHTADDIVGSGILQGQSPVHQGGNDHLVIVISRKSDSGPCQFGRLHQKFVRRTVPYSDGQGRLRQEYMSGGPDTQEG